jgi:hypothetical protein
VGEQLLSHSPDSHRVLRSEAEVRPVAELTEALEQWFGVGFLGVHGTAYLMMRLLLAVSD